MPNATEDVVSHECYTEALSKLYEHQQYAVEEEYDAYETSSLNNEVQGKRTKRKEKTLMRLLCAWVVQHQIGRGPSTAAIRFTQADMHQGLSANLLLLLGLTHMCFPRARRRTRRFLELSYYDASIGLYTQGWDDLCLVAFWIVLFTGVRAVAMDYVLKPFAGWGGVQKQKARIRFAEQAWLLLYYSVFWTLGMVGSMLSTWYPFNIRTR